MGLFDFRCRPEMAWLTVDRRCNFRCQWCYCKATHYDPKDTMSLATAKELVEISIDAGAKHFNIIGGEPTLWPSLLEFNKFCRSLGVTTGLITNTARFGDDQYWNQYQQNPCDEISISVKSTDREQFRDVTGATIYDKTMKGIKRAISFHHTGITTVYNSLVGLDGLKQIAMTCRKFGASSIMVNMCSPIIGDNGVEQGFAVEPRQLVKDVMNMHPFLDKLYEGKVEIDIQMPLCLFPTSFVKENLAKKQLATVCQVFSRTGINFDINGDVLVCNELFSGIIAKRGVDYYDGASLLMHLNNDELCEDYRQLLRYPSEACHSCRWKNDCRGGCLLNWMIFDPSICRTVI
jgi:radical SAM protein with 4Fe4S-binding SPASM domain